MAGSRQDYPYIVFCQFRPGCPSDRVAGAGCFGAALMLRPELVASCCKAMGEAVRTPITIKCRLGEQVRGCAVPKAEAILHLHLHYSRPQHAGFPYIHSMVCPCRCGQL